MVDGRLTLIPSPYTQLCRL